MRASRLVVGWGSIANRNDNRFALTINGDCGFVALSTTRGCGLFALVLSRDCSVCVMMTVPIQMFPFRPDLFSSRL